MNDNKTLALPLDSHSAVFSEDRVYRYELRRHWGYGDKILWIMLNPSTADEVDDDPTVRRCIRFSQKWGFGSLIVCNLFAYRSTDPKILKTLENPSGPENWRTIRAAAGQCSKIVCAWGVHGELKDAGRRMISLLRENNFAPQCLGMTKDGHPKHPLYISYKQPLIALGRPNR